MNTLFPGRADYMGPMSGRFGLLHHDRLYEKSHDVAERVDYVKNNKPRREIAVRLYNMIYLGEIAETCNKRAPLNADYRAKCAPLDADYRAKCAPLDADYRAKRAALNADYRAKRAALDAEILAYIKLQIPDCAWDGEELRYA